MKRANNSRQWEQFSAYVDGKLTTNENKNIEALLVSHPELQKTIDQIKQLKTILRSIPVKNIRRNFTLGADHARHARKSRIAPIFSYASLATGLVLIALLAIQFIPGLISLPTALKSAEVAPIMMAVAPAESPTALPPLILWNGYYPSATGGAEGKGGGGGAGYGYGGGGGGGSGQIVPTATPVSPEIMPVYPPVAETPVPTPTPFPTEPATTLDQAQLAAGPFLGIQPTQNQGKIIEQPNETRSVNKPQPSGFGLNVLNYVEIGLAALVVGFVITALVLRKRN